MMSNDETYKLPRIYTANDLREGTSVPLDASQAHYFKSVLRRQDGDEIRLFNGHDGEWLGKLDALTKKSGAVKLERQLKPQPKAARRIHLIFTPIKKDRMDWLVEKAVELGATDLHPVLTQNTEVRKVNEERLRKQVFEAAEQCERMGIPSLHPLKPVLNLLSEWKHGPILACLERFDAQPITKEAKKSGNLAVLIGPEGGFTAEEKTKIAANKETRPVSLGETVLRCETAAVKALILANNP